MSILTAGRSLRILIESFLLSLFGLLLLCPADITAQESTSDSETPEPIFELDFDENTGGLEDLENAEIAEGKGARGTDGLKVTYEGYHRGSKRVIKHFDLPRKLKHATLHFHVRFPRGFQFVKGGKMHGLAPEDPITGCSDMKPEGWSARIMWRHGGLLKTYSYYQHKESDCGDLGRIARKPFHASKFYGKYIPIMLYVRLNDPAQKRNGVSSLFVNGVPVSIQENLQFRTKDTEGSKIQKFLFTTFHGGSSKEWAPKTRSGEVTSIHAYYDNFRVFQGMHVPGFNR